MKKLFSTLLLFLAVFTLSACTDDTTDLDARILELEAQIEVLNLDNENYETQVSDLEAQIAALEELIFDNIINISLKDEDGNIDLFSIGYDDDYTGSLIGLLEDEVDLEYSVTDFGTFISSIGGLESQMGSYIAITLNGQMSMVGIDDLEFDDQDVVGFEVSWWDEDLHQLDQAINLFLENQASNYVNSDSVDYNVALALNALDVIDEYVSATEVSGLYPLDFVYNTSGDYFKAIMKLSSVSADSLSQMEALSDIAAVGAYGKTAYDLIGLNAYSHEYDYSVFEAAALTDLTTVNTPFALGLDSGGISLVALSNYRDEANVVDVVNEYLLWISTDQLNSGGVLTRDNGWGSSENASSISSVIIGMVSWGEDPTGEDYTKEGNTLVSRLLEFQTEDGTFNYLIDDVNSDTMFSTPQAFLALVMYQQYKELYNTSFNPYNFE